jgi:hypothetical protein
MSVFDDIVQFGFEAVTQWIIKGEKIGPASFKWLDHSGWLYAFLVEEEVRYIGLTDRVLRSRMGDYSHINNSQTNRLRGLIRGELEAGRVVDVFGWKQRDINILKIEEVRLRATYRPPWNRI